jgi:L-lactate dehydrogenase complex protein LldF
MASEFHDRIHQTLHDPKLQLKVYAATARAISHRTEAIDVDRLPDYQELRTHANALKRYAIEHLDHYLEQFEANVIRNGGKVIWCRDAREAGDFVLKLAAERKARLIVKSKSMTTEEIDFNERVEHHGLKSVETDLGEYIMQLNHERPYHIVAPALHKTRYDVGEIFARELGVPYETEPEKLTMTARGILRDQFLAADIGVSGANFLVADSGAIGIVENEGNARLSTTLPKVHIAIAGIEKVIPRAQDLPVFLKLLTASSTGQRITVYTSFLSGPRREGEIDGPEELYVLLLDNGRTKLLADPSKRESLYCIRCGACLNHCPVYRKIGGHSFPWVYSGPIGAVLTPQFKGIDHEPGLPFASSLCGACGEVCPVKIDLPRLLLELRADTQAHHRSLAKSEPERWAFGLFAWLMTHPKLFSLAGWIASRLPLARFAPFAPPLRAWLRGRTLPPLAKQSFRAAWKQRGKA